MKRSRGLLNLTSKKSWELLNLEKKKLEFAEIEKKELRFAEFRKQKKRAEICWI